jgi:hypothetical protein
MIPAGLLFRSPSRRGGERQPRSLTENLRHHSFDIALGAESAKARDTRPVEIPIVLLQTPETPDRRMELRFC